MSLWRQLTRGLRVLTHRAAADQEIDDEVQHYLEEATAEQAARGVDPDAAKRAALIELGSAAYVRQQVRDHGWERVVDTLIADLRYAAWRLRRNPGFTAVAVLTLALGIGANTAIFSAVNPILFEPLPYPDAHRIMMIWYASADGSRALQTFGNYREVTTRSRAFESMAVMKPWQPTMTGSVEPERFEGQRVSASYFRVLGVAPTLGLDFDPAGDRPAGLDVVILSDSLWRRRFSADRTIVGRQVTLDDRLYTVRGVMPSGFENVLAPAAEIWSLLQYDASLPANGREWGHHLRMVGRTRAGLGVDQARQDLAEIASAPVREFVRPPWSSMQPGLIVNSLQDEVTRGVRPALVAVLGAVSLVLMIACVNVTNLLLARGAERRGELALRAALGAGRGRLIRQLLTESLLLAALGGGLGMVVADLGTRALVALSPPGLPRVGAIGFDGTVLAFGLVTSTLVGLAFGSIPAFQAVRGVMRSGFGSDHHASRIAGGHQVARRTLVVAEVALAFVLLVGSGLLLRSMQQLFAIEPGFNPSHVLTMQVQVASARRYPDEAALHRFFARALDRVREVPGVESAAFTSQLPLTEDSEMYGVRFQDDSDPKDEHDAYLYAVTAGYFATMGIPLRRGRLFDSHDTPDAFVRPVLISESFARRKFPGRDPIGQRIRFGGPPDRPWDVIVGVVGDVRQTSLAAGPTDGVYVTTAQWLWVDTRLWLVARARADAAALVPAIRAAIWSVDKDQPIVRVATMDALLAETTAERRFALILFQAFAVVALALAAIGIYGVLAGSVAERTREIGVRTALGATRREILTLFVRQGMALAGTGVAIGLAGAAVASRAVVTLLFGVSRLDPVTYVGTIGLLLSVSAIACWVPAWRAACADPSRALRAE